MLNCNTMIDLSSTKIALFYYKAPFKSPLAFNGHTLNYREGLLIRAKDEKQFFYGEIAPLPGFSKETLAQAKLHIIDVFNNPASTELVLFPSVSFALSSLSHSLFANKKLTNHDIVPLLQGSLERIIAEYIQLDYPDIIKLKVARQSVEKEIELIEKLHQLNPSLKIRLDANQQWDCLQTAIFFSAVNLQAIDYIEEPTPNHEDNLALAEQYNFKLALDETLQNPKFNYQNHPNISAFVIKPTLMGDHTRVQLLIDLAKKFQLQVNISSSFESVIGLSHLALISQKNSDYKSLTLGIDTLKQFNPNELFDIDNFNGVNTFEETISEIINQQECVWKNY